MTRDGIDFIEKDEVVVKREDLEEAIWELNEWSGSGPCRHSSNVDKLLTRLRAAKEGNHG